MVSPDKKKGIILVETPFQLLCAYEYVNQYPGSYYYFLRKSGVGINDKQMDSMVKDLGIDVSRFFLIKPRDWKSIVLATFHFFIFAYKPYNKVILGSYFSGVLKIFSSILPKNEVVLLDDGVATLLANEIIRNKKPKKYSAFSIFKLDASIYKNFNLNRFNALVDKFACTSNTEYAAFFIGQRLVEIAAIDMESYIRLVQYAVKDSNGMILHYIPHRAESKAIIEKIAAIPGVKILHSDVAIEHFLLKRHWYPKKLYSIISTALYSLSHIFPKAECFALKTDSLKTEIFKHYQLIIEAFSQNKNIKFNVVE